MQGLKFQGLQMRTGLGSWGSDFGVLRVPES